ncbi:MAG TPA: hypothetical protein VFW22_16690, partial [Pseudolabrys sp.]|nr:hypothetical protein [Pseudolabrys sp.]
AAAWRPAPSTANGQIDRLAGHAILLTCRPAIPCGGRRKEERIGPRTSVQVSAEQPHRENREEEDVRLSFARGTRAAPLRYPGTTRVHLEGD